MQSVNGNKFSLGRKTCLLLEKKVRNLSLWLIYLRNICCKIVSFCKLCAILFMYLFIFFFDTICPTDVYTSDPWPALNPITLFVLWLRLETPALFTQSMYHTAKLPSRCWRVSGGSRAHATLHLYWNTGQRQDSTSDKWPLPPPLQKHLFRCVGLFNLQMPDCSRNFSYRARPRSLPRRRSEIKAGASGLGVEARRRWHFPFTPRRVTSPRISLARHIPQQRELPPSYHPSKRGFYGPSKDNEPPEWKERSQREVTANTPDVD